MTERAAFCQLMGNLAASMPKHFGGFTRSDSTRKWRLINRSDPIFDRHAVSNSCSYRRPSHLDALLSETVFLSALWCRRLPGTVYPVHRHVADSDPGLPAGAPLLQLPDEKQVGGNLQKENERDETRDVKRYRETPRDMDNRGKEGRGQSIVTKHKLKAVKKQAG